MMEEQNYLSDMQKPASTIQNAPAPSMTKSICIPQETEIKDVRLAHAYVPFQKLCNTFTPMEALKKGTAFPPLYNVYRWEGSGMGGFYDE